MSRLGLLLTAVAVVVAGWLGWAYASADIPDSPPPGDRVLTAVAALKTSNVYVDPDTEGLLSTAEISRINAAAAAADPEVLVVIWRDSTEAGYYPSSQALQQIGADLGRPGFYISADAKEITSDEVGIKSDDYVSDFGAVDYDDGLADGELATGLLKLIGDNDGRDFSEADTTGSDYWGGTAGTTAAGALIGTLAGAVLATVVAIAWFVLRGRRRTT